MEQEILQAVRETNENINRLAALIAVAVIIWILKSASVIFVQIGIWMKQEWRKYARRLYEKGKFEKLLSEATKQIIKEPKNPDGFYWKAHAEKELKYMDQLKRTISDLLEIAPKWKEDWMDQYVGDRSTEEESDKGNSQQVAAGNDTGCARSSPAL